MLKKLLFIFFILPIAISAQVKEINWISLNKAEELMKKEPRKILIDVYTDWCGPCRMMNNTTFKDPKVVDFINKNFYAVKFNAEGPDDLTFKGTTYKNEQYDPNRSGRNGTHDLTRAIAPVNGRIAYPTIVYMDENFKIISPVQGFQKPEQILPLLSFMADEAYTTTTWQAYMENYKK